MTCLSFASGRFYGVTRALIRATWTGSSGRLQLMRASSVLWPKFVELQEKVDAYLEQLRFASRSGVTPKRRIERLGPPSAIGGTNAVIAVKEA